MNKVKMEDNTVDQVCSEVHTFRLFTFFQIFFKLFQVIDFCPFKQQNLVMTLCPPTPCIHVFFGKN